MTPSVSVTFLFNTGELAMSSYNKPGRPRNHPAELCRAEGRRATDHGVNLDGFYNPAESHGPIEHVYGDPEKFENDMKLFEERKRYRLNQDFRWWIQKDFIEVIATSDHPIP